MAKKKAAAGKASAKDAKKAKAAAKTERKQAKAQKKSKTRDGDEDDDDDQDLEGILEKMRIEWEEKHRVTEETVEGPPSRRANATFTPDPNGNHLWSIGGEFFSEDGKAHFYNDVYRYTPEKNEWRRYTSATCPGPRSAHAVVATPSAGGKLFLFGGEFSSLHQTTFHHYRDLWEFDISTHTWERIETKTKPTARSGHRMAVWKHFFVLFGGFYDPGIRTQYLNDLWIFDMQEYKWTQIEMKDADRKPSPRSGFSFVPTPDGVVLHGGYCKEYVKGKRAKGIALEDTWFLRFVPSLSAVFFHFIGISLVRMSTDLKTLKWERRKKVGYVPSVRSGCTMAYWANRETGVLFGGVKDDDQNEETLVSEFYNDMFGYSTSGNGRWSSLMLKKKKKPGGGGRRQKQVKQQEQRRGQHDSDEDEVAYDEDGNELHPPEKEPETPVVTAPPPDEEEGPVVPLARYNTMLAVLRNTLYIYGGILERGTREITLDDFWSLALDKMDAFVCLKELTVDVIAEGEESSDDEDDEDGEDDEDSDDDEGSAAGDDSIAPAVTGAVDDEEEEAVETVEEAQPEDQLRAQANDFLNAANNISAADAVGTPLPGETLATFYERTREYWTQQAFATSNNRGKELRRDGFALAEERYNVYKPLLKEVEKILAEAGLDAEEMKRAAGAGPSASGTSRNRR
ncbi:galactose oxidase [Clavulina sp. PMI_390]|nr:galactose oxidase [Clavulina sp. PMI_390]